MLLHLGSSELTTCTNDCRNLKLGRALKSTNELGDKRRRVLFSCFMTALQSNLPTNLNRTGQQKGTAIYHDLPMMIEMRQNSFPLALSTRCLKDSHGDLYRRILHFVK
jgi:hypothetical protein